MNRVIIRIADVALLLLLFFSLDSKTEGFAAGVLIKTPTGYVKIEDIQRGDPVICIDDKKNYVTSFVTSIVKKSIDQHVRITVENESISLACDQRLYDEKNGVWIAVLSLKNNDILAGHEIKIELINETIEVYLIGVAQYHNFLVTYADICAHNFFPFVIALSAAFGSGAIELVSVSVGFATLGALFGYSWHKKDKQQKHGVEIQHQPYANAMMPEDPEEEKKRKREEARKEYRSLTNKEAKEIAQEFYYRKVKDHPCGNTRNQPVFFNGKNYISPDIDGHKGGLWKVFNRKGDILYTTSRRFEKIVKIYEK